MKTKKYIRILPYDLAKISTVVIVVVMAVLLCTHITQAGQIDYRIANENDGRLFDGTASFKFAVISGITVLWSNDGTSMDGSEPVSSLKLYVSKGSFLAKLGTEPMKPLYTELVARYPDAFLRVWVDTGHGFKQLPDMFLKGDFISDLPRPGLMRDKKNAVEAKIKSEVMNSAKGEENEATHADEWFKLRHMQRGDIPMDGLVKAKRHIDKMRKDRSSKKSKEEMSIQGDQGEMSALGAGISQWEWLGPGNIGGRIRSILIHPTDPDRMWIGSVSGGIWYSANGGGSWTPVDDFMASLNISSLVMDPTNPDIMYAGTGEFEGSASTVPGAGIFKSTDGAVTWSQLASTNNSSFKYVNRLAHHPTQANRLFAATNNAVYESSNGGSDWVRILDTSSYNIDIKIHPTSPDHMILGSLLDVYTYSAGTWTRQSTGNFCNTTCDDNKLPRGSSEVAFAPSDPNIMYVSMNRNGGEIWRSTNGGSTWMRQSTGTNYLGTRGLYNNTIWVNPINSDVVVVGGIDLWRSTEGGSNLTKISDWRGYHTGFSAHADQHAIVHHPDYNGTTNRKVYVGNDGGIQMTNDILTVTENSGWVNLANSLGITQFYGGAAAPDGSVIVGGSQDNDKLRYRPADGTGGWYQAETGDGGYAAVNYIDPNIIYGEYAALTIKKSDNGGHDYYIAINGLGDAGTSAALFIAPFVMHPNDPSILIAGGKKIWETRDSASLWSMIRDDVPLQGRCGLYPKRCTRDDDCPYPVQCALYVPVASAVDVSKSDGNVYWVGYSTGNIAKTPDEGVTWINIDDSTTPPLPAKYVTDIAINPSDHNEVIITYGRGYIGVCSSTSTIECDDDSDCPSGQICLNDSVWRTTDGGATWQRKGGTAPNNLPLIQVNTVTFHPSNANRIYIGTDLGIFASEDKGVNWSVDPADPGAGHMGPANVEVDDLFWQGESLIAATHGRGMFRTDLMIIYVDAAAAPGGDGSITRPYKTVTEAVNAARPGATIMIKSATYNESPIFLDKQGFIHINGSGLVLIK